MTLFQHKLHTTRANYESIQFFYENIEQVPQPGKNLFLVYVIDPDGIVYETCFKCLECEIADRVTEFIENN